MAKKGKIIIKWVYQKNKTLKQSAKQFQMVKLAKKRQNNSKIGILEKQNAKIVSKIVSDGKTGKDWQNNSKMCIL